MTRSIHADFAGSQFKSIPNSSSMPMPAGIGRTPNSRMEIAILDGRWCCTLDLTTSSHGFVAT